MSYIFSQDGHLLSDMESTFRKSLRTSYMNDPYGVLRHYLIT